MTEEKLEKNEEEQVEKNSGTNDIKIEQPSLDEKLKETEDKLLRSLAETENQRRRFEKELKEAFEYGGFNFAKENLAILDNLQRAKVAIKNDKELKDNKDLNKFLKNLDIIENDLVSIFEKNNIKKINSTNQQFDPNKHQAMLEVEHETLQVGSIVQEIQAGYMFGERLLRPSFVSVAKKKTSKEEKNNEKKDD